MALKVMCLKLKEPWWHPKSVMHEDLGSWVTANCVASQARGARVVRLGRRTSRSCSQGDTLRVLCLKLLETSWSAQRVTPVDWVARQDAVPQAQIAWVALLGHHASRSRSMGGPLKRHASRCGRLDGIIRAS